MKKLKFTLRHGIYFIVFLTCLYVAIKLIALTQTETKALKTIYLWNGDAVPKDFFTIEEEMDSQVLFKSETFRMEMYQPPRCPVACRYTTKPKFLSTADAVVFFHVGFANYLKAKVLQPSRRSAQPNERPAHQLYIFFEMEPPNRGTEMTLEIPGFFNHTMSYRRDSTIHLPYYEMVRARREPQNYFPDMSKKSKFAAWIVSHCSTQSRRRFLVHALRSFVQVDIYGQCNNVPTPCAGVSVEKCFQILGKTYKFYLSFESALCVDYVTEKFFFALKSDMIPVVYGQANYSSLAPPKSYIDISDFPTIRDLALYLKRLDRNETEYLEYFEWKKNWDVSASSGWEDPYCILCQKLISGDLEKKPSVIENVTNWWMTAKDGRSHACKFPPARFFSGGISEQFQTDTDPLEF